MASEFEYLSKQKNFINEISWFLEAEKNHEILLIKNFCLTINSNSDAIFVFTEVDLDNRILIRGQNSDLEFSTSSTARPKLSRLLDWPPYVRFLYKMVCDLPIGSYSLGQAMGSQIGKKNFKALPTLHQIISFRAFQQKNFPYCKRQCNINVRVTTAPLQNQVENSQWTNRAM